MTKTYSTAQKRLFRRWVKQMFSSFIKRQDFNCQEKIVKVIAMLHEIEESIDMIAREIARRAKLGK